MAAILQSLTLTAFRGITDLILDEMAPLNLVVGSNNAGKSTILEAAGIVLRPPDIGQWIEAVRQRDTAMDVGQGICSLFPGTRAMPPATEKYELAPMILDAVIQGRPRHVVTSALVTKVQSLAADLDEGVQDAVFMGRVLQQFFGAKKAENAKALDEPRQKWFQQFKWPVKDNIARLNVPAPIMYRLGDFDTLVAVRNAEGISKIIDTLEDDFDVLSRIDAFPDVIGIVLDSDKEPQAKRHAEFRRKIQAIRIDGHTLAVPENMTEIGAGRPALGVFALPGLGQEGALEDVLLDLGRSIYPELTQTAGAYVMNWHGQVQHDERKEWKELKALSGQKKATVAAMTALLKPGKSAAATIEDNQWVSPATKEHAALAPFIQFMKALVEPPGPPQDHAP